MSLRLEHVQVTLGSGRSARNVLWGVSVEFRPGVVTAVVGPNGAGKSTLLRTALGLVSPRGGSVRLDGRAVDDVRGKDRARRLVYVPQRSSVAFAFTVRDIVWMGLHAAGASAEDGAAERASRALATVELADRAQDPVGELSAGQQQRVSIARALVQVEAGLCPHGVAGGPRGSVVLLADEPVSAMDPRHALGALRLLRALAGAGAAVGVVLHDLSLAAMIADEVIALGPGGSIVRQGVAAEVLVPDVLAPLMGIDFVRVPIPGGVLIGPSIQQGVDPADTIAG